MSFTIRETASIAIAVLSGAALWMLPAHVRGDNQLFGANGTLLPALALSIICALSVLDTVRNLHARRRNSPPPADRRADDAVFGRVEIAGMLLVTGLALLFTVALGTLGYLLAAVLLVLALMFGTGGRDLRVNLVVSILAVLILYAGVRYGLGVRLQPWPDLAFRAG